MCHNLYAAQQSLGLQTQPRVVDIGSTFGQITQMRVPHAADTQAGSLGGAHVTRMQDPSHHQSLSIPLHLHCGVPCCGPRERPRAVVNQVYKLQQTLRHVCLYQ